MYGITDNNVRIPNFSETANAFNNFAKVAIDNQSYIRFSKKKFFDDVPLLNIESFFITPESTELSIIISSLNLGQNDRLSFWLKKYQINRQFYSTNLFRLEYFLQF